MPFTMLVTMSNHTFRLLLRDLRIISQNPTVQTFISYTSMLPSKFYT